MRMSVMAALVVAGALAVAGCGVVGGKKLPSAKSADYYTADGKFDEKAAKQAYLDLMAFHGYPVNDAIRKDLFVSDMALGKFPDVGLACISLVQEKQANYGALEIFLLPGQMIPEHWHVALDGAGVTAKRESWIVRYGKTYTYGAGPATEPMAVKVPECEAAFVTTKCEKKLEPGEETGIKSALEKHWQQAGPEGVILTEVSTYHDGAAVRFTDPKIKF